MKSNRMTRQKETRPIPAISLAVFAVILTIARLNRSSDAKRHQR